MRLVGLLVILLSGCATVWTDVPTGTWDPRAYDHNVRECAERGLVFDHVRVECVEPTP